MISLFRRNPTPQPEQITVRIGATTYPVAVRRLVSARRYTLRVRTAQRDIVLSMPARGSLTTAKAFADKHAGWIALKLAKLAQDVSFADGAMVPFRDVPHRIEHREGRGTVKIEAGSPPVLVVHGDVQHLPRRLTDWLKKQALRELQAIVARHTAALGVKGSRRVLELILDVKKRGLPIVLISHNMPHVFEVADRIHIHRLGKRLAVIDPKDFTMSDAVAFMTGAKVPPPETMAA